MTFTRKCRSGRDSCKGKLNRYIVGLMATFDAGQKELGPVAEETLTPDDKKDAAKFAVSLLERINLSNPQNSNLGRIGEDLKAKILEAAGQITPPDIRLPEFNKFSNGFEMIRGFAIKHLRSLLISNAFGSERVTIGPIGLPSQVLTEKFNEDLTGVSLMRYLTAELQRANAVLSDGTVLNSGVRAAADFYEGVIRMMISPAKEMALPEHSRFRLPNPFSLIHRKAS